MPAQIFALLPLIFFLFELYLRLLFPYEPFDPMTVKVEG